MLDWLEFALTLDGLDWNLLMEPDSETTGAGKERE